MSLADIVIIVYLALGLIIGWRSGTIRVIAGLGSLVIGYWAAREFSALFAAQLTRSIPALTPSGGDDLLSLLSLFIDTGAIANRFVQMVAFIIIFIVVTYLIRRLAGLLDGILRGTILGAINSILGAACAFGISLLIFNFAFGVVLPIFSENQTIQNVLDFIAEATVMLPLMGDLQELIGSGIDLV